jgi:hypothetical protein
MSALDWIALLVCVLSVVGASVRIWRREVPSIRDVPAVWPWGAIAWRAYVRCLPSMVVAAVTFLAVFAVLASVPERADGPFARPVAVVVPALTALALSLLVILCVAMFNRPKVLVSRDLRREPGAVAELLARRRRQP